MKKIIVLTLIALSSASTYAQSNDKEAAAAAKQAAKELKAQQAADLKEFKAKQKADLAAFIEKQKNGTVANKVEVSIPELKTQADSVAYLFGAAQTRGLVQYMTAQLGVDTTYMNEFTQGIIETTNTVETPSSKAYNEGSKIAGQLSRMTESLSKEYYAADPEMSIDNKIVVNSLVTSLLGNGNIAAEDAGSKLDEIMQARQIQNKETLYGPNRIAGEKWLEENKKKDGVVTLPSGLQYKVLTQGNGSTPKSTDKVSVNYEGKLIDGTVFDSSYKRGKPTSFGVTQVIKGWTEALQLMNVGSKWEVYIPYQLAYGDKETGKEIKPYSALIFTVELLDIESKDNAADKTQGNKGAKNSQTTAKKK